MSSAVLSYDRIQDDALSLPLKDRSKLAGKLLKSLDDDDSEISGEWRDELNHRVTEIDEGRATLVSKEDVWERVNQRFGTDFKA